MEKQSLGLIETLGFVPAVEAADTGTKAANVSLLGYGNVDAGLITVKFCGDVAAVEAAVTAAAAAASRVGKVVAVHVIPRPHRQLRIGPPEGLPPPVKEGPAVPPPPPAPEEKEVEEAPSEAQPSPTEATEPLPESIGEKKTREKKLKGKKKGRVER